MCGRYAFYDLAKLKRDWGVLDEIRFEPSLQIFPGTLAPIIEGKTKPKLRVVYWGWEPLWPIDGKRRRRLINARWETLATKASFCQWLNSGRCLIPANGFYEFIKLDQKMSQPIYLRHQNKQSLIYLAGLFNQEAFVITTKQANLWIRDIHKRMPVVLDQPAAKLWLDQGNDMMVRQRLSQIEIPLIQGLADADADNL